MKLFFTISIVLFFSLKISAQDFKPYKIKSGKIEYELRKYSTRSHYSNVNGVESSSYKQVPYVAEIINYYWDDFGDVAYEESWQVVKFGGDPIPKKKKYEKLWTGDHRYYYDIAEDRLVDDPFHTRIECRDRFQYYQIMGSWVETIYMGAKKTDTLQLLGKEAIYYQINNSHDLHVWKGLVLKDESYSTRVNGERFVIERAKIATKIDTGLVFDQLMFDSARLKKDLYFKSIDKNAINNLIDGEPNKLSQIQESGFEIKEGDIIVYVTSDAHIGKLKVLKTNKEALIIKYITYDDYGDIFSQSSTLTIPKTFSCNLDDESVNEDKIYQQDFKYKFIKTPLLLPTETLGFYLVKGIKPQDKP